MDVFDASALLVLLQQEPGADVVEQGLASGSGVVSAANWSEVAQKVRSAGADWSLARAVLASHGVQVEPVTREDAERAAALWARGSGLSLADRLCLATGERLGATVWTADAAWGSSGRVRQVRPVP